MLIELGALVSLVLSAHLDFVLGVPQRDFPFKFNPSDEVSMNFPFGIPPWLSPDIFGQPGELPSTGRRPPKTKPPPFWDIPESNPSEEPDEEIDSESEEEKLPPPSGDKNSKRRLLPEGNCGIELSTNILGGRKANIEDFPWMALLGVRLGNGRVSYGCAGSLITPQYVLTAAHCVQMNNIPANALERVRLGEYDTRRGKDCDNEKCNNGAIEVEIAERIVHRGYVSLSSGSGKNDIALLRLKTPVKFNSYVYPVCLPLDDLANKNYDGTKMLAAGWGVTELKTDSPVKKKVKIPVVPLATCQRNFENVGDTQICAGGERNRNTCNGDSGGPLMNQQLVGGNPRWILQGIVSFGPQKCGKRGVPAVYTRVGKYIDWILNNIRK